MGLIVEEGGNTHLELDGGASSRVHDFFFVDGAVALWSFRYRVMSADSAGDDTLLITLERNGVTLELASLPIATATPWADVELATPPIVDGSYRLIVELTGGLGSGASIGSIVAIDDLTYTAGVQFTRGDCNSDATTGLPDALAILNYLFMGGSIGCAKACDSNDNGALELIDAIVLLQYLFSGGAPLPTPSPDCGVDRSADSLGCEISGCP